MKKILTGVMIIMLVTVFFCIPAKAQSNIIGIWKTVSDEGADKGKDKSYVEIFEKSGAYFAKVTKLLLKPQDTLCDKCKDDLKNKPVVGMIFLQDMKKAGKMDEEFGDEYSGGTIMDPDSGTTYKCKMWIKNDVLTVRGYKGISLLGRSQKWSRVK
jgi:uncharacterized protein (DUF2147 family)